MAAPPNVPTVPNTPLSNRYHDGIINDYTRPPNGPCNYVNVNAGGNFPKCGCRRFTDRSLELRSYGSAGAVLPGYCVCEHHSCYHTHDPVDGYRASNGAPVAEGLSWTPKPSDRQTSAPRADVSMQDAPEVGVLAKPDLLQDTIQWSRFIKSGSSQGSLPAIPSQCLLPSENGSRASSSQAAYTRPFGGKGLNTLTQVPRPSSLRNAPNLGKGRIMGENGKIMEVYQDSNGHGFLQSLTEVATPSAQSQDLDGEPVFNRNITNVQDALKKLEDRKTTPTSLTVAMRASEEAGSNNTRPVTLRNDSSDELLLPKIRNIINHVADYPMIKRNHEHRLDQLENSSFNNSAVDHIRDDHELLESRVGELESRMEEVEKQQMAQSDTNSVGSRQLVTASFDSRSSSALVASAIDRLDHPRIDALEAQILELQALAPPSHARAWEVEVVFLPFGSCLTGIWSSSQPSITQLSRVNSGSGDEWTQTQHNSMAAAQARLTANDRTVAWETSATDLNEQSSPWLMPKACGVGSLVDDRLRSRGLVRRVQVKGPDARDVQAAIMAAFRDLPNILAEDPYSHHDHTITIPDEMTHYYGLQAPWIPLRKVHKNSCLRFLNTSEMLTPALWTVSFLSSSVAMRSTGIRRLYVTQPDSYIQHHAPTSSWTWSKIRQLDRVYPSPTTHHTPEADAHEPCWAYDSRYDLPPSTTSSLSSHPSPSILSLPYAQLDPASPSDHFSSAPISPNLSTTPPLPAVPPSPLRERHPFRPLHTRTTSLPSLPCLVPLKGAPKRRIEPRSSPTPINTSTSAHSLSGTKRQRTRSPSRAPSRDTPRWSVGPPSPYIQLEDFKRGTTPFAYATPHSNAPYIPRHLSGEMDGYEDDEGDERGSLTDEDDEDGGGDGRALSDYEGEGERDGSVELGGDEWEGVGDDVLITHSGVLSQGWDEDDEVDGGNENSDSCPSEYPSRQPEVGWAEDSTRGGETMAGFHIHVDERDDGVRQ